MVWGLFRPDPPDYRATLPREPMWSVPVAPASQGQIDLMCREIAALRARVEALEQMNGGGR